jgi:hypothetical protein
MLMTQSDIWWTLLTRISTELRTLCLEFHLWVADRVLCRELFLTVFCHALTRSHWAAFAIRLVSLQDVKKVRVSEIIVTALLINAAPDDTCVRNMSI